MRGEAVKPDVLDWRPGAGDSGDDQPKHKSALHEHKVNCGMIYLDPGTDRITYKKGVWRMGPLALTRSTEFRWRYNTRARTSASDRSASSFQSTALDSPKLWPKFFRIPIHNRQVRVLVNLTDQHFRVIDESGRAVEITAKTGDVHWAKPNKHIEENLCDQPFEGVYTADMAHAGRVTR